MLLGKYNLSTPFFLAKNDITKSARLSFILQENSKYTIVLNKKSSCETLDERDKTNLEVTKVTPLVCFL